MADEVGRRRTMPQLPPVDPSVPSCSNRTESSIVNVNQIVVAVNAANIANARQDPPRFEIEKPGDDLALVPTRKRAKLDDNATRTTCLSSANTLVSDGPVQKRVKSA